MNMAALVLTIMVMIGSRKEMKKAVTSQNTV